MSPNRTKPARAAVTINDVAHAAGVSKSTVSLVLQNSALIKQETAERVRKAAEKLGYVYNRQAADLRRKSSNIIGVVINDLGNPFFAELLVGMERKLADAGYICLMAHTEERLDIQDRVLASMREHHAAGLILCPALDTPEVLRTTVQSWGIPLLTVVRQLGKGGYDFVGADNEAGFRLATEHLVAAGHRRIALVGGLAGAAYEDRRAGFVRGMKDRGLAVAPEWFIEAPPTRAGGLDGMRRILTLDDPPSAAVCYNDLVAFGALSALGERGMKAGEDFALIGFDGVAATEHSNPPLSTIDVGPSQLGAKAADVLLQRLADPQGAPIRYLAQPKLVVRQSSARGRSKSGSHGAPVPVGSNAAGRFQPGSRRMARPTAKKR